MNRQRTIAKALHIAFNHSRDHLGWLAECAHLAHEETANISETLQALAAVYHSNDINAKPEDEQLASVLYGLSNRLETMDAMLFIAREADAILKARKQRA